MRGTDFVEEAQTLLGALGYRSERTLADQSGRPQDFAAAFPARNPDTETEQAFLDASSSVRVLFQVTDEEIGDGAQLMLIREDGSGAGISRSFLFTAVELRGGEYPRGRYADFTREINKRFPTVPSVVLFRTASGLLTLAFVHVRPNRRDPNRNVIGSVSLIREIDPVAPHRAHLDILAELSLHDRLRWMDTHGKRRNFDGLLEAWLDALDTEELNRRFYRELFGWFERAVVEASFPGRGARVLRPEEHVIRLITRLLFIWFIKEKGLVAEELFVEEQAGPLLEGYDHDSGDSYYRAVLQNLFFATLNTEIAQRGFSSQRQTTHRNFSLYRYNAEMVDPDALLALFAQTPFINGGLFDCLDTEEATSDGGHRIDYFTDNPSQRRGYSIPNRLFFDEEGLIPLFNHYKFTVEENTPAEQEVALDPELLGKVFENLLAAYNPETRETARKQTGSYYTPRAVVDYMVDEALVEALAQKAKPSNRGSASRQDRLRYLLDYNDAFEDAADLFDENETDHIVRAIAELRVLDPAVGSGAFPMGVLHKLTLALRRLDPDNRRWEALQREVAISRAESAFSVRDQEERDELLDEISDTFERYRDSDFGRKLYLVQNSIYGVDIQPVACQIAKLRFFISLAIEQQPIGDSNANYGIQPLPNLETRFVTADTLLGLGEATQVPLVGGQNRVTELNDQLRENRERHFHAGVRSEKLGLRKEDARLRVLLAKELRRAGMSASHAGKVSGWDPYDQNASAGWFDAGYMFDVKDGFDVVIGNPPYVQLQKEGGRLGNVYKDTGYVTFTRTGDVYQLFYEKGFRLLAPGGLLSYITSNSWLKAEYGKSTRRHMAERHTVLRLLETGKDVFENVIVDTSILIGRGGKTGETGKAVDMDSLADKDFPPDEKLWSEVHPQGDKPWSILPPLEQSVMDKMLKAGTPLKEWDVRINYGIKTGFNKAFIIDDATKRALIARDPNSADIIKPVLRGRNIQRYQAKWAGLWLIDTHNGYSGVSAIDIDDYPAVKAHLDRSYARLEKRQDKGRTPYNLRNCAYYEEFAKEKLFWIDLTDRGRFAFDEGSMFCANTAYMITGPSIRYLCAVLNSNLITWFMKNTALNSGMGTPRWVRFTVERLPISRISAAKQRPFIRLVDGILEAKASDPDADTSEQEAEIDGMVYELYGLTEEESTAIERRLGLIHASDEEEDAALARAIEEGLASERVGRKEVMAMLRDPDGG